MKIYQVISSLYSCNFEHELNQLHQIESWMRSMRIENLDHFLYLFLHCAEMPYARVKNIFEIFIKNYI